jgi:hypothetical protein
MAMRKGRVIFVVGFVAASAFGVIGGADGKWPRRKW